MVSTHLEISAENGKLCIPDSAKIGKEKLFASTWEVHQSKAKSYISDLFTQSEQSVFHILRKKNCLPLLCDLLPVHAKGITV